MGDIEDMANMCQSFHIGDSIHVAGKLDIYKQRIESWQKDEYYHCWVHQTPLEAYEDEEEGSMYGLYCKECGMTYIIHTGDPELLSEND